MTDTAPDAIDEFLQGLQIPVNDLSVYQTALTHSSYTNEQDLPPWKGNERLEFLGDAVIGLATTAALFECYPESDEGRLSKIKSVAVSRSTLADLAAELGLGELLLLGVGEDRSGGRERASILAAVFESFVGALYLDQGFAVTEEFCRLKLLPVIETLGSGDEAQDDKSRLQELTQQQTGLIPRYRVTGASGPDHDKWFEVEVTLRSAVLGAGGGPSKKSAEQEAAKAALERFQQYPGDLLGLI